MMKPVTRRALPIARSSRATSIGSRVLDVLSANTSAVATRKSATSTTRTETCPVTMEATSTSRTSGPRHVHGHHEQPAVQPVGQGAGVQPEDQRRQPLDGRRQRHQERVVRLGGHQQGARGQRDAVAEVARPRGREQPPKARAETPRDQGVDDPAHKAVSLVSRIHRCQAVLRRPRRRTRTVSAMAPPTRPIETAPSETRLAVVGLGITPSVVVEPLPSPGTSTA